MCDPPDAPYLDPLDSNVDPLPPSTISRNAWRVAARHPHKALHEPHQHARTIIIASMLDCGLYATSKRALRMAECRAHPHIYVDADGEARVCIGACRDRACPTCAAVKAKQTAAHVHRIIQAWDRPRMLTLTLDHRGEPLRDMVDRLLSSYRRIRQTASWRSHVDAAVATMEVTYSIADCQWHAHLHVLLRGRYYPIDDIRRDWLRATGGAKIVWIEPLKSHANAARYIAKYVTKPASISCWPPDTICHWADALRGRRTLITSGAAHGVPAPKVDPAPARPRHGVIIGWGHLRLAIRAGVHHALVLARRLCVRSPALAAYLPRLDGIQPTSDPAHAQLTHRSDADLVRAVRGWLDCRPPPSPRSRSAPPRVTRDNQPLLKYADKPEPRPNSLGPPAPATQPPPPRAYGVREGAASHRPE